MTDLADRSARELRLMIGRKSISPVELRPAEKTSLILPFCEKPLTPSIHRSRGIGIVVVVSVDGSIESTWIESAR